MIDGLAGVKALVKRARRDDGVSPDQEGVMLEDPDWLRLLGRTLEQSRVHETDAAAGLVLRQAELRIVVPDSVFPKPRSDHGRARAPGADEKLVHAAGAHETV